jgi:acyl-CoA synthetase (AMP-forming)/AMP-acid ligase II
MLIELLRSGAAEVPDQPLIVAADRTLSYAEVLNVSENLARGLDRRSIARFACLGDATDMLPLVCASTATGAEACVYPSALDSSAVEQYSGLFGHRNVVTALPLLLDSVRMVRVDELAITEGELASPPERTPALILTTGTTGRPKAVRHDWGRLVAAAKHVEPRPGARWLLAYNLNQFAGVQVMIHVLLSRATLVVPSSFRPRDAVKVIRDFDVTHVSATPTFWRFVVSMLDEAAAGELPLRQITLGGEAVPGGLVERLSRLFPSARISQIYASTEFGSTVSVRDSEIGLPVSVLERGEDADVQMRIVDGELQIRSRVGMVGYYGEDDADADWRPTGDLVELRDDRIIFVGRTSDIINVGGIKVHPLPVEEIIGKVADVALVRAYARANPVTGQIVAVDVVARSGADTERLGDEIRASCDALPPAARPRRIRFVDELEMRGQKIVRGQEQANG